MVHCWNIDILVVGVEQTVVIKKAFQLCKKLTTNFLDASNDNVHQFQVHFHGIIVLLELA